MWYLCKEEQFLSTLQASGVANGRLTSYWSATKIFKSSQEIYVKKSLEFWRWNCAGTLTVPVRSLVCTFHAVSFKWHIWKLWVHARGFDFLMMFIYWLESLAECDALIINKHCFFPSLYKWKSWKVIWCHSFLFLMSKILFSKD